MLNCETSKLGLGLSIPHLAVISHNFTGNTELKVTEKLCIIISYYFNHQTEPDTEFDSYLYDQPLNNNPPQQQSQQQQQPLINPTISLGTPSLTLSLNGGATSTPKSDDPIESATVDVQHHCDVSLTVNDELNSTPVPGPAMTLSHVVKGLIRFLSQETTHPLWNYEDITAKGIIFFNMDL